MSRLLDNSDQFRDPLLAKNVHTNSDEYSVGHSRALSDGDEHGKGATDTIGNVTDIAKRQELEAKNMYTSNDPYDATKA